MNTRTAGYGQPVPRNGSRPTALSVSAVICTRNRPTDLDRTLTSLAWQDTKVDEIVVVDDSDPDRRDETRQICDGAGAIPVEILTKDTPGLTASRNLAIEHIRGDLTMFFDDDVILRPDYVSQMVHAFTSDDGLAGAGGSVDDDHEYGWQRLRAVLMVPGRKTGRVYPSGWSTQLPRARSAIVEHLHGCNMVYRTDVLRSYRFNDEFRGYALGEDLELSHRLHLDGHRLEAVGSARLWHLTGRPTMDRTWGYREVVIRPLVADHRFGRAAFMLSSLTFLFANLVRNRPRAAGNWLAIRDVLAGRPPRDLQTLRKDH